MGQISLSLPQVGGSNLTQEPLIPGDFTTLQNVINGNLDATNISASLAQSAQVNQSGQVVKGATNIATSESRTNTAFGTLTTPDQVTGIVLPANGLIAIWYQATWSESVSGASRAAIFLGANSIAVSVGGAAGAPSQPNTQAVNGGTAGVLASLATCWSGLNSFQSFGTGYTGDVTTGQIVGTGTQSAGPCYIFAAAGTYTASVQFKATSGSVTASNRRLWVQALSFA